MITCPACGKENEDSAFECKRCRAPLRDEVPEEQPAQDAPHAEAAPAPDSSESLGEVCRRCETYNEPGVRLCTNCGFDLFAAASAVEEPPAEVAPMDRTPPQAFAPPHRPTPPEGNPSISEELKALALSDDEAAEAGLTGGSGEREPPMDGTPPEASAPRHEEPPPPPPASTARAVAAGAAAATGAVVGAAAGIAARRPPPEPPKAPAPTPAA